MVKTETVDEQSLHKTSRTVQNLSEFYTMAGADDNEHASQIRIKASLCSIFMTLNMHDSSNR